MLIYDPKFAETIEQISDHILDKIALVTVKNFENSLLQFVDYQKNVISAPRYFDPVFILFTSGTTGQPKGVPYTHEMLTWNSFDTAMRLNLDSDDVTVLCMPPFHTGGLNVLFAPMLHRGATVVLQSKFHPSDTLVLLEKYQASIFMAVPTIVKMMSETKEFDQVNLSRLKYMVVGGEALALTLINKWEAKGIKFRQGYGLTEAGPSITSLHQDDCLRKRGSIGKFNFYVDAVLMDENQKPVEKGTPGELWLKGPSVMKGYLNNPKANETSFVNGWFKTGDMMKEDEEGYLFIVDRIKNMYKSGGENIYPAEVEKAILQHPDISEVIVVGVNDLKWGEVGKAFLVLKSDSNISIEDLVDFLSQKLAKFKIPKHFRFLEKFPLTDTGKIDRKKLLDYE